MDLSKLIAASKVRAEANPQYIIKPKHATLIEYQIQEWISPSNDYEGEGCWQTLPGHIYKGLKGFSDAAKVIRAMRADAEYGMKTLRMIAIGEVSA